MQVFRSLSYISICLVVLGLFVGQSAASLGDRLPDFKECVKVRKDLSNRPGLGSFLTVIARYVKRKIARMVILPYVSLPSSAIYFFLRLTYET